MHLAVAGGGCTGVCAYIGLLQSLGWDRFDLPFDTATAYSAGAIAISLFLLDVPTTPEMVHGFWTGAMERMNPIAALEGTSDSLVSRDDLLAAVREHFPGFPLDLTLLEMHILTGVHVRYGASVLDNGGFVAHPLCYRTHPHMPVIDALLSSCCVPLLFEPLVLPECGPLYDGELTSGVDADVLLKLTERGMDWTGHRFLDHALRIVAGLTYINSRAMMRAFAQNSGARTVTLPLQPKFDVDLADCTSVYGEGAACAAAMLEAFAAVRAQQDGAAEKKC